MSKKLSRGSMATNDNPIDQIMDLEMSGLEMSDLEMSGLEMSNVETKNKKDANKKCGWCNQIEDFSDNLKIKSTKKDQMSNYEDDFDDTEIESISLAMKSHKIDHEILSLVTREEVKARGIDLTLTDDQELFAYIMSDLDISQAQEINVIQSLDSLLPHNPNSKNKVYGLRFNNGKFEYMVNNTFRNPSIEPIWRTKLTDVYYTNLDLGSDYNGYYDTTNARFTIEVLREKVTLLKDKTRMSIVIGRLIGLLFEIINTEI